MSSPSSRPNALSAWLSPVTASLAVHAALSGAMAYVFYSGEALIAGDAGLAGAVRTRSSLVVTMEEVVVPPPARSAPPPVREGLAIAKPLPRELPTEVKSATREIEEPPSSEPTSAAEGNSNEGPTGTPGQGGTSNVAASQLGEGDRSNARGLYIAQVHRKIQAELRSPGYLPETKRVMIEVVIEETGEVSKVSVLRSSGDQRLDLIAVSTVKRAQPFAPWRERLILNLPVKFNAKNQFQ